ncbi:MAG: hypothetical protein OEZ43_07750 [Gammaproteobacteria bacterium]|nr:hypothetical protein [Gammaproteobacteria bacterium]
MAVGKGQFQLYGSIEPDLKAGDWKFVADTKLTANKDGQALGNNDLKVDRSEIHIRVRSPRYLLPPDQVLSTFPPANSSGSYGSRLPQVVIKRRTLPWERQIDGQPERVPWLALVLIAQEEAILETGISVDQCVTSGVTLPGVKDVEKGNCLVIRKSMIDKIFPTQEDVELLVHAREVDINDTELMMGDDDGFLSVVVCNRLPLPGRDDEGNEVPVKYLACLINLEGQFDALLEKSPPYLAYTTFVSKATNYIKSLAQSDHQAMSTTIKTHFDGVSSGTGSLDAPSPLAGADSGSTAYSISTGANTIGVQSNPVKSHWGKKKDKPSDSMSVQLKMAKDFAYADIPNFLLDKTYRFPVLLHWSFTSSGSTTFRYLMQHLDSRLLGDTGTHSKPLDGRLPLEVVETGHLGLNHKTREGDEVRSWYRGPLVPHPTKSSVADRLPLAHSSDQLRIVVPDGREDLSLASAFEIGRLLTLSQPSIINSLLRWRQRHYHAARLRSILDSRLENWRELLGEDIREETLKHLGPIVGRFFAKAIVTQPEKFVGNPRVTISPGRPMPFDGMATDILGRGLGIDTHLLRGDIGRILDNIRDLETPTMNFELNDIGRVNFRENLQASLNNQKVDIVSNTLNSILQNNVLVGPNVSVLDISKKTVNFDILDRILAAEKDEENI